MVDILHRVGVETASPEKVYDALTTVDGSPAPNDVHVAFPD